MIDLKTLYEQTTMYCTLIDAFDSPMYHIEIYHQPDTPIYIRAVFDKRSFNKSVITDILRKISFSVDEGEYIL